MKKLNFIEAILKIIILLSSLFVVWVMTVVGFNWPVERDNAVAVIVYGELVFASEEERWTRHKHSPGESLIKTSREVPEGLCVQEVRCSIISTGPACSLKVSFGFCAVLNAVDFVGFAVSLYV